MNQPVNTILSNQQLQVELHNYDLLERLRALRGSGGGSGDFNLDSVFVGAGALNLQSNNAANFVLSGNQITQWNDISGNNNHATQATAGSRPLLTGGKPTFDGVDDFLTLTTGINLANYTLYIVMKLDLVEVQPNYRGFLGQTAGPGTFSIYYDSIGRQLMNITVGSSAPITVNNYGGAEVLHVFSLKSNDPSNIWYNDARSTINPAFTKANIVVNQIGKPYLGTPMQGQILAVCIAPSVIDDATDYLIKGGLYARYNVPFTGVDSFMGDSLTAGSPGNFPKIISDARSKYNFNRGIGGARMTVFDYKSVVTRWQAELVTRNFSDHIYLLIGANDRSVPLSDFDTAYETVISGLIAAGYPRLNIHIASLTWTSLSAAQVLSDMRNVAKNKAAKYGTMFVDFYQLMVDTGNPASMISGDNLHPTTAAGLQLASWWLNNESQVTAQYISSKIDDNDPTLLLVTLNKAINTTTAGWTFTTSGGAVTITGVENNGLSTVVNLRLSRQIYKDETLSVDYNAGVGSAVDIYGIVVPTITAQTVTNRPLAILFFDDFNDGVIDPAKWAVTNPNAATGVLISETGGLLQIIEDPAQPVANSQSNHIDSVPSFTRPVLVVRFDSNNSGTAGSRFQTAMLRIWDTSQPYATADRIEIIKTNAASPIAQFNIWKNGVNIYSVTSGANIWRARNWKIVFNSNGTVSFYVGTWVQQGVTQSFTFSGPVGISMEGNSSASDTGTQYTAFDNVYMTDKDFSTSIPS